MTNTIESNEEIVMEPGDREWFKDILKAELTPMKDRLNALPCVDHENRITVCQTKIENGRTVNKDWRSWLLGIGIILATGLAAYAAFTN